MKGQSALRDIVRGLIGLSLFAGVSQLPVMAQTMQWTLSCASDGFVKIENTGSPTPIDVRLYVVFSEYKSAGSDTDCTIPAGEVQINSHIESEISQGVLGRSFNFQGLGFNIPSTCDTYLLSARATRVDTGETITASC